MTGRVLFTITSTETIRNEIGSFGASVPNRGDRADKRTSEQREDYCLRYFLFGLNEVGGLRFPVKVVRSTANSHLPDFLLNWTNPSIERGVEVTEATTEDWQHELNKTSRPDLDEHSGFVGIISNEGYVGDEPERMTVDVVIQAIEKKIKKLTTGSYSAVEACDLLIYVNNREHIVANHSKFIQELRLAFYGWAELRNPFFSSVHTLTDRYLDLNLQSSSYRQVDVGRFHRDRLVAAE